MRKRPIRRANLISPFGPGAISVTPDGTALITTGLDHWFTLPPGMNPSQFDPDEFKFTEWRLERELGVDFLMLPPDHRERAWNQTYSDHPARNEGLKIPFLRFPRWHICSNPRCARLKLFPLVL